MPTITIDESRIRHIFRQAEGDFPEDTVVNRQTLVEIANRRTNLQGTDQFGNAWFAETRADGTQVWAQVRGDKITNGRVNPTTRDLSPSRSTIAPVSESTQ